MSVWASSSFSKREGAMLYISDHQYIYHINFISLLTIFENSAIIVKSPKSEGCVWMASPQPGEVGWGPSTRHFRGALVYQPLRKARAVSQ